MKFQSFVLFVLACVAALAVTSAPTLSQGQSVDNLSFEADIYGNENPETLEYISDLSFHNFGGFGRNAHIFRAWFRSDDVVAYAVSANSESAFALEVVTEREETVQLSLTPSDYSAGTVVMSSSNELQFTWEFMEAGLHFKLHRLVRLAQEQAVTAGHILHENFSVENLGQPFSIKAFSEQLHMDDKAVAQDYDCDGVEEALLAVNSYSTDGYPVLGKAYKAHRVLAGRKILINGNYATVTNTWPRPVSVDEGETSSLISAVYLAATAKNSEEAVAEIDQDIAVVLNRQGQEPRYFARSYNTDDAAGIFINGRLTVGTSYRTYPDSGWHCLNSRLKRNENNVLSFATYDIGVCCSSDWGFGLRREDDELWSDAGEGPYEQGIRYARVLKLKADGSLVEQKQSPPESPLDGDWSVLARVTNGAGFVLVENQPVAGSAEGREQWVEITDLLGKQDNHLHLNAWSSGGSGHSWYFAIRKGETLLWESEGQPEFTERGPSYYLQLKVDEDGNVYPLLDLPVDYQERSSSSQSHFLVAFASTRVTSLFDHRFPYQKDEKFLPYTGYEWDDPADEDEVCRFGQNCYDGHEGYDIDDLCTAQYPCSNETAVYPAADGKVVTEDTGWDEALGCRITVDHGNGWSTVYGHLADVPTNSQKCENADLLEYVTQSQQIGVIDCTGSGCKLDKTHLHFEVRYQNNVVDPSGWNPEPTIFADPWKERSYPMWLHLLQSRGEIAKSTGGTLTSAANDIKITVPSDYSAESLAFHLSYVPASGESKTYTNVGNSFSLIAFDSTANVVEQIVASATVEVAYDPERLRGLQHDTIGLFRWNQETAEWQRLPTQLDEEAHRATATTRKLGTFALLAEPLDSTYLPMVLVTGGEGKE